MSETDWKKNEQKALVGLAQAVRALKAASYDLRGLVTLKVAAQRLGVSRRGMRLLLALDLVDTVKVGRRTMVMLPLP